MKMANEAFEQSRMFKDLTQPRDLSKYTLMRGAPDFANVAMWNEFESGYAYLVVVQIPRFLEMLAERDTVIYKPLIDTYRKVLEYEFKNLEGIDNITADTGTIDTGISQLQFINKVNMQSSTNFTMRYTEKAGSVIAKVHELFLTGIKDGRTQVKHYHGLIEDSYNSDPEHPLEAGYELETFSFMYFVTDNTFRKVEKAYYIVAAQPTNSPSGDLYNYDKSNIEFKEVTVEFVGFPITGNKINAKARAMLDWLNNPENPNRVIVNSNNFDYTGVDELPTQV